MPPRGADQDASKAPEAAPRVLAAPSLTLPKGGGAVRDLGEKFAANSMTGSASLLLPLPLSPGRNGFGPSLALTYDSAAGNSPFGVGWRLDVPSIARKTDRGIPRYDDASGSDTFILSGTEDLVPVLMPNGSRHKGRQDRDGQGWSVERYRPRIEGLFSRIERWTRHDGGEIFWRTISRDNVTTLLGRSAASRISDPADPARVFSWLAEEVTDVRGEAMLFGYLVDDRGGADIGAANEANRTGADVAANRLLKRVRYGRRKPTAVEPDHEAAGFHFELVLDYGDHDRDVPTPAADRAPAFRRDPFSNRRPGFELRTQRLCQRVLMFHHFPAEAEVGGDCLVRALELAYRADAPGGEGDPARGHAYGSFLASATLAGFRRKNGGYLRRVMPPLEFAYSDLAFSDEVRDADPDALADIPGGVDGNTLRWVDLDGEGLPGVLAEHGGSWWFKRNLGEGRFGRAEALPSRPSAGFPAGAARQFTDLAGDGTVDFVEFSGPAPGFHERTSDGGWTAHRAFASLPVLDWDDPALRMADLSGDGLADLLITEGDEIVWHRSLGEAGFDGARRIPAPSDEERSPRLVSWDAQEAVHLADMVGDGLVDIVRVRNGEVAYWPSLGHGRFGAKVTMDSAPRLDREGRFRPDLVRLADTDGSGTTDIVYLGPDGVDVHLNCMGNSWAKPIRLPGFPGVDASSAVDLVDLLGKGTSCLVWYSPLPADVGRSLRFVDLMRHGKPHLLKLICNNIGAETRISYAASTRFFLDDRAAGRPWVTRLPFPVHLVERVETTDLVSRNRFVTRSGYHHGHFDGREREFRGFAFVERWDGDEIGALEDGGGPGLDGDLVAGSRLPPVLTRTWTHTGSFLPGGPLAAHLARDFHGAPPPGDPAHAAFVEGLLADAPLPPGLTAEEEFEACRALKGTPIREEVFSPDRSGALGHPLLVAEHSHTVRPVQAKGPNAHAVFLPVPRESVTFHVEGDAEDARVVHALTLEVDGFGNVLRSATIAYGRAKADPDLSAEDQARQAQPLATLAEAAFTDPLDEDDDFRAPAERERRSHELTGAVAAGGVARLAFEAVDRSVQEADRIGYEVGPTPGGVELRLVERAVVLHRRDDLDDARGPLPAERQGRLGLVHHTQRLVFTPGLLAQAYGGEFTDADMRDAAYKRDEDGNWWVPSGRVLLAADGIGAAAELAEASRSFFFARRYVDPFGNASSVRPDPHFLLPQETEDAVGNRVTAGERAADGSLASQGNDYRVLQPRLLTDPNGNRIAVLRDALGLVVAAASMGKPGESLGDSLDGLDSDPDEATIGAALADTVAAAAGMLGSATTRHVHDLWGFGRVGGFARPPCVWSLSRRNRHHADLAPGEPPTVDQSIAFSDGFGREVQVKSLAEPGPVVEDGPDVTPRWTASAWCVFDNKGNPIRAYEPFHSVTHEFTADAKAGVSSTLVRDALGRVVAQVHPDRTWEKAALSPWRTDTWTRGDTVLDDPTVDPEVGDAMSRLPRTEVLPTWHEERVNPALSAARWPDRAPDGTPLPDSVRLRAEQRAAAEASEVHARTPSTVHLDPLGREIVEVARNRLVRTVGGAPAVTEAELTARRLFDIEGNTVAVVDARGRTAARRTYNMTGVRVAELALDDGALILLPDAAGETRIERDALGRRTATVRDALRRPTAIVVTLPGGAERTVERVRYGEAAGASAEADNLRGQVWRRLDATGEATVERYDFKGNATHLAHRHRLDPATDADWPFWDAAGALLEDEPWKSRIWVDARSRTVQRVLPHRAAEAGGQHAVAVQLGADGLTVAMQAWVGLAAEPTALLNPTTATDHAVREVRRDAKGRRTLLVRGNGVRTRATYDRETGRLASMVTDGPGAAVLQSLRHLYDVDSRLIAQTDDAQPDIYFANAVVEPTQTYAYDAFGRLVEAAGREHAGRSDVPWGGWDGGGRAGLAHPADGSAMRRYIERFDYDEVGNLTALAHAVPANPTGNWRRDYAYDESSPFEDETAAARRNRLTSSRLSGAGQAARDEAFEHDALGRMTAMPHLSVLSWDERDHLRAAARQSTGLGAQPEITFYEQDAEGGRARKATFRAAPVGAVRTRATEHLHLGALERVREYGVDGVTLERERIRIWLTSDGEDYAEIDLRTVGADSGPPRAVRFPLHDQLGSVTAETDGAGAVVTRQEFYAYGGIALEAHAGGWRSPMSLRGFAGKDRDAETGLLHCGRRYYAPWLGRWTTPDPSGLADGPNPYAYVSGNPVTLHDPGGRSGEPSNWNRVWGGVRLAGGAVQATAGIAFGIATAETGVGIAIGVVAVVHGYSDMKAGLKQVISGREEKSDVEEAVTYVAKKAGMEEGRAEALGLTTDMALGFVSPAPGAGAPAAGARLATAGPRLAVAVPRVATAVRAAPAVSHGLHGAMMAEKLGDKAVKSGGAQGAGGSSGGASGGGKPPGKPGQAPGGPGAPKGPPLRTDEIIARGFPMGFKSLGQFKQFGEALVAGLKRLGFDGVVARIEGSAVTGRSAETGRVFDVGRVSDLDVSLSSQKLFDAAKAAGADIRGSGIRTGPLSDSVIQKLGLADLQTKLSRLAGRPVNFVVSSDAAEAARRSQGITVR